MASVQSRSIVSAAHTRHYLHYTAVGSHLPLVLMLHGTGGTAAFAAQETGLGEYLAERGYHVVFPDGLPVHPEQPPRFLSNPQRWNDGSTQPGHPLHTETDDVAFLLQLIRLFHEEHSVDADRVYLCGFSNGASMTFRLAASHPESLAAIAPIAGYCHMRPRALHPRVPTLYLCGDADLLIPWQGGAVTVPWGNMQQNRPAVLENLQHWADALGCQLAPVMVQETDQLWLGQYPGPCLFQVGVVKALGHHWPGGLGQFNPRIAGPHHLLVSANQWLHEHFHQHRRKVE